jgi:hypothetical protein
MMVDAPRRALYSIWPYCRLSHINIVDDLVTDGGLDTFGWNPSFSRIVGFDGTFSQS